MPRLPNEILDEIWLERCELGFEPRILQAKWINVGHMRLPAFYVAQPQAFMTQLCHGAREVAAKGFYSRVFDNPSTGDGGFWWNEDDVLYIDVEFYRELHPSRKALVLGRDKITRVALDIQIDEDSTIIVELITDWFPNLSQVFFTGSARLFSDLEYGEEPVQCPRPEVSESALTKSISITRFYPQCCPKDLIPRKLFVRVQGLTDLVEWYFDNEEMECFIETSWAGLLFLIFDRDDARSALGPSVSPHKDGGEYQRRQCLFILRMLTATSNQKRRRSGNDCQCPSFPFQMHRGLV